MSTSASSSPSTSRQNKFSAWLPISAFIGTSLALAIPLFMLHRQRHGKNALRISLKSPHAPPPPRRSTSSFTLAPQRGTTFTPAAVSPKGHGLGETTSEPSDTSSSPGIREIISAISQMNQSSALLAAKAFAIATGIVAVGGVTFTWAVKTSLGVEDTREFGEKMRSVFQATIPGLRARLYRPSETDDEHYEALVQGVALPSAIEDEWNWRDAEERLKKAYEEGGITVWAQTALQELEAEARVERTKRDQEQEVAPASGKQNINKPSLS